MGPQGAVRVRDGLFTEYALDDCYDEMFDRSGEARQTYDALHRRLLELSPADASERGIRTGDRVRVWNASGEVRCVVKISSDVRQGVCVLPKGLWRKHTRNGYTANALIPAGLADLGGQAAYNDARVQVARD